jgi:hypothetical protein
MLLRLKRQIKCKRTCPLRTRSDGKSEGFAGPTLLTICRAAGHTSWVLTSGRHTSHWPWCFALTVSKAMCGSGKRWNDGLAVPSYLHYAENKHGKAHSKAEIPQDYEEDPKRKVLSERRGMPLRADDSRSKPRPGEDVYFQSKYNVHADSAVSRKY